MKTPFPQEAAKWASRKARGLRGDWNILYGEDCVVPAEAIERALLDADKNGYERGKKDAYDLSRSPEMTEAIKQVREIQERDLDDETLLREAAGALRGALHHIDFAKRFTEATCNHGPNWADVLSKLESRLAPEGER